MDWLLFLPQIPTSKVNLCITVWRCMRAAGALGLRNGIWVLPYRPDLESYLEKMLDHIKNQGATGYIFETNTLTPALELDLIERFQANRSEEYNEFGEKCDALKIELDQESLRGTYSFAELEEAESELKQLQTWYAKIKARDFVGAQLAQKAQEQLEICQSACHSFAQKVYAAQILEQSELVCV
jgi:hypothetical protein